MSLEELHPYSSSDMAPIYLCLSLIGGKSLRPPSIRLCFYLMVLRIDVLTRIIELKFASLARLSDSGLAQSV
ncbi:hypothetical protein [Sphingobium sp. MP9-4]|uniref:hypothetical protein n=1 Tax=Sphingobium sp. MP9-4 TaxID=1761936 RepID=UPI0010CA8BFF|nr:hypothetical protein [Sphingobium sp. MP9-4]